MAALNPDNGALESRPARTAPGRVLDPVTSWRKHWRKSLVAAGVVVALGIPVVFAKGKATFYAEAALRISPSYVGNLQDQGDVQLASTTQYQQFVQQQLTIARSYDVARDALTALGPQRELWQRPDESERHAAERLMATVSARAVKDTYLITIGLEGTKADGLAEIVNAVANAYVGRAEEEGLFGTEARIKQLEERRVTLQGQIDANVQQLTAIAQALGVSTFEESSLNPLDTTLVATGEALADWRRRRLAAEARLAALDAAQKRELELEIDTAVKAAVEKDPAVLAATKHYYEKRTALLDQASGLAPEHPATKSIHRQLADLDAELALTTTTATAAIRANLEQRRRTRAAEERSRAELEAHQTRDVERQIEAELAGQQARLSEYAAKYQAGLDLTAEIRRARKRVETINNRIEFFVVESHAPGFVRIVSSARPPVQPLGGGKKSLTLMILVAAIGLGAGLPLALDRFDPRVLVPGDVEKTLGIPPLGWIVERCDGPTTALATDQIRRLALAVDRERRQHGTTRIALTAVQAGCGTTTLALELARELTAHGVRTLALDADTTNRDRRYEGEPHTQGLVTVLASAAAPEASIVRGDDRLPDRLPLGAAHEGQLLGNRARLLQALAALGNTYDLVLIDAPPLLLSAEGEFITQLAEGAFLVVAANRVVPADLTRAARVLERLAPPVVGVLLNRVRIYDQGGAFLKLLAPGGAEPARTQLGFVYRWLWA